MSRAVILRGALGRAVASAKRAGLWRTAVGTSLVAAFMLGSLREAAAQDTAYCRQVRARAASDADLLMAPRMTVQGIRFPSGGRQLDTGPTTDGGYQLRTGLAFSPVDFYKGQATLRVGDAECRRHEAALVLDAALTHNLAASRLVALRGQHDFLLSRQGAWRALAEKSSVRFSQRIITVVEFTDVQRLVTALERKVVQVDGDARLLEARAVAARARGADPRATAGATLTRPTAAPGSGARAGAVASLSISDLSQRYLNEALQFEREVSGLRQLDDWRVQVTGGVIPLEPVEWYGALELSFNLGGLVRSAHEDAYVEARASELRESRAGVATRVGEFRAEARAVLEHARQDLELVERSLQVIRKTATALASSQADSAAHARDVLELEQLSIESDVAFLRALIDAVRPFAEGQG